MKKLLMYLMKRTPRKITKREKARSRDGEKMLRGIVPTGTLRFVLFNNLYFYWYRIKNIAKLIAKYGIYLASIIDDIPLYFLFLEIASAAL